MTTKTNIPSNIQDVDLDSVTGGGEARGRSMTTSGHDKLSRAQTPEAGKHDVEYDFVDQVCVSID